MNLLERVLTLLRINVDTMIEKADDPEKVLRQLQLDMRNQLVQVKTQVATALAESHKLQNRSKEKMAEADLWMKKAEQALQQENEEGARKALMRYNDIKRLATRYEQQQKEQEQFVVTMRGVLRQLESRIAEIDASIELLSMRRRNALIQQRIYDALNKSGGAQQQERVARAQDALLEAEARARALAELHRQNLDVQLEQLSEEQVIEQQLNELRARKRSAQEPPLLTNPDAQEAPLIRPRPQRKGPERAEPQIARDGEQAPSASAGEIDVNEIKKLLQDLQNGSSQENRRG